MLAINVLQSIGQIPQLPKGARQPRPRTRGIQVSCLMLALHVLQSIAQLPQLPQGACLPRPRTGVIQVSCFMLALNVLQSIGQFPQLPQLPHPRTGVMPYASHQRSPKHRPIPSATPGRTPTTSADGAYSNSSPSIFSKALPNSFSYPREHTNHIRGQGIFKFMPYAKDENEGYTGRGGVLRWFDGKTWIFSSGITKHILDHAYQRPRTRVMPCASPRRSPKHRPTPSRRVVFKFMHYARC